MIFKLRNDPRVTRLGQLLRKTSTDELPQLINVVLGHMSLVGPRPPMPDEVAEYGKLEHRRLLVRPGMTGLWQVITDALVLKVRESGRVVGVHALVATGVNNDGHREILGLHVTTAEDGAGWLAFFRDRLAHGLTGVKLVTSDAHQGLVTAIGATLTGAGWQRSSVNIGGGVMVPLVDPHCRERTLAA